MPKKNPWGRPSKIDEESIKKLEEMFKLDCTIAEACSYAWISHTTYHDWCNKDKEFSDRMERAKNYAFILSRKVLMKGIRDGNDKNALEFLKRRDRRYSDKNETIVNNNINVDNLYDEED